MPPSRRTAEPQSVGAVLEDLKLTREVGGVQRASVNELETTLRWLFPDEEELGNEHLPYAQSLVETHLNRACEGYSEQHRSDPCAQATAASLRSLYFQPADKQAKAQNLRRDALRECGCSLSPDGLRKREDVPPLPNRSTLPTAHFAPRTRTVRGFRRIPRDGNSGRSV
jgi:hypothetical protein